MTPWRSSQAPLPKEQTDESLFTMSKTLEPHRAGAMGSRLRCPRHRNLMDEPDAGGARRDRTDDLLLAKQALSQLSYGPLGTPSCKHDGDPG